MDSESRQLAYARSCVGEKRDGECPPRVHGFFEPFDPKRDRFGLRLEGFVLLDAKRFAQSGDASVSFLPTSSSDSPGASTCRSAGF